MRTSLIVALVAGGLSPINPCGFSLLPAFLALQITGDPHRNDRGAARVASGVTAGVKVGLGFIFVFVAAGIPLALGASFITRYVAWAGATVGVALAAAGVWVLFGKQLRLYTQLAQGRGSRGPIAFGVGYGAASLGCSLPVFLSVVAVGAASSAAVEVAASFIAYATGTLATLIVLGVGAAYASGSAAGRFKRLIPHMQKVGGSLLLIAGVYLSYYWVRVATLGATDAYRDPIAGRVRGTVAATERLAAEHGPQVMAIILVAAAVAVAVAVGARSLGKLSTARDSGAAPDIPALSEHPSATTVRARRPSHQRPGSRN